MGKNKKKAGKSAGQQSGPPKPQSQASLENEPKFIELPSSDEEDLDRIATPPPSPPPANKEATKSKKKDSKVDCEIKNKQNETEKKDLKNNKKENVKVEKNLEKSKENEKNDKSSELEKNLQKPEECEMIEKSPEVKEKKSKLQSANNEKTPSSKNDKSEGKVEESKVEEKIEECKIEEKKEKSNESLSVPQGDCIVCDRKAKTFCSGCKHVFYCTRDHQKNHWKTHKEDCKTLKKIPYRIERNDTLGRFLVATTDIKEGELIFNDSPIVLGPRQLTKPVCLGCHSVLKGPKSVYKCSRCTWPMCSKECENKPIHADSECRMLRYGGVKMNVETYGSINMMYASITVLRTLALKEGPTKIWNDYTKFDSHLEKRMSTPVYSQVNKEKVVFFIHHYLRLVSKFSDLEILEACGKLDTNCFEIRQFGLNLRGLYRIGSIMSHDCCPNTRHTFGPDHSINVYATTNIRKGEIISATYTQPLWSTMNRREHLHMSKCFWCNCKRCQDPTEFGTYLSAFSCSNCGGRMLSMDPLNQHSIWKCEKCKFTLDAEEVKSGNERLTKEIKETDRTSIDDLEDFLKKYATILPDTHQLVREIQYGIVCLFKMNENQITTSQLLRKAFLCKQLLNVADKIDKGSSKWRGQLLFEMQSANVILAQRALSEGRITKFQAQELFQENLLHLQESVTILQVEPEEKDKLQEAMKNLSDEMENLDV